MPYCPYTDEDLPDSLTNSEHIIPLSLGGINGLEIPVCKRANSELGSTVDAKIGKELIIESARTKLMIKGHSGKPAKMYFKNAVDTESGQTVQLTISKQAGLSAKTPYLNPALDLPTGRQYTIPIASGTDIWLQYVAKVFLAAGYYVYGDHFRNGVNTEALRILMRHSNTEILERYQTEVSSIFDAHFIYQEDTSPYISLFRGICKILPNDSCIGFVVEPKSLHCFTSILGNYIGSISIEADTIDFPNIDHFRQGHFLCVQNGKLFRSSHRHILLKLYKLLPENIRAQYPTPY